MATPSVQALPKHTRFCIIGAGLSGVTAAATLRRAGYENITLLEQAAAVGGHCLTTPRGLDLGVSFYSPFYPYAPKKLLQELGIKIKWITNRGLYYSLTTGKRVQYMSLKENLRVLYEIARYGYLHYFHWRGVKALQPAETSPQLHEPWSSYARRNGFVQLEHLLRGFIRASGHDPKIPAFYITRLVPPKLLFLYAVSPQRAVAGFEQGAQAIVKRLVTLYQLQVKTSVTIQRITRSKTVQVSFFNAKREPQRITCDYLILACNPKRLLKALDATPEENTLFNMINTRPYYTYEVAVDGILVGKSGVINFKENLNANQCDHPMQLYKKSSDDNLCTVYIPASPHSTAQQRVLNLRYDIEHIGGKLIKILTCKAWKNHCPSVDTAALNAGFFRRLHAWQGKNRTVGVGSVYTVDALPFIFAHARQTMKQLIEQKLPGQDQTRVAS